MVEEMSDKKADKNAVLFQKAVNGFVLESEGGFGSDTYILASGSGHDTVIETRRYADEIDTVSVGAGILASDVSITRHADDITLRITSTGDELVIQNTADGEAGIERVVFDEGTEWNAPTLATRQADITTDTGVLFNYTVQSNFVDADAGDVLQYSATLTDGNPLPAWISSFDTVTATFNGTPVTAVDAGNIDIRVTAVDSKGLSVTDTFTLSVVSSIDMKLTATDANAASVSDVFIVTVNSVLNVIRGGTSDE